MTQTSLTEAIVTAGVGWNACGCSCLASSPSQLPGAVSTRMVATLIGCADAKGWTEVEVADALRAYHDGDTASYLTLVS